MAGKARHKIDYAGWATDIFENDTKIDKLLDAQSWVGFGIYFYLCQRAFSSEGYFYRWSYDDCASTARRMGCGVGSSTVRETVDYCLQIGLFDRRLFDGWGVLTSRGIQRSYWVVAKTRRDKTVYQELWLLDNTECEGVVFAPLNSNMSETNGDSSATNSDMSETNATVVENSRVEKSKVNNIVESKDSICRSEVRRAVDAWNNLSEFGIKPIHKLTSGTKRHDSLVARIKQYGIDDVLAAIERIKRSKFLQGKSNSKRQWCITFDWFVLPNNFPKVLEGNYDDSSETETKPCEIEKDGRQ